MKSVKVKFRAIILVPCLLTTFMLCSVAADPIAITNVRVFDGNGLSEPRTVVIENGLISDKITADTAIDGNGNTLLPGLIDSHVHLEGAESLRNAAQWGVTTMLDMGTDTDAVKDSRGRPGLPAILGSGISAAPTGSLHATMGCAAVTTKEEARAFIADRVAENVDYIKVIADSRNKAGSVIIDEAVLAELVVAAHENNLKVIAHVTLDASIDMCFRTDVDVITHLPLGKPIDAELAMKIIKKRMAAIPTLVMMQCFFNAIPPEASLSGGMDYANSAASMNALENAGVIIMAGTDANTTVCRVIHGESLHSELQLMVAAGMSPLEALRSATVVPAEYWGLNDRGLIEPGRRADLVLVEGNPTQDISATKNIMGVWINGEQVR